MVTVAQDLHYKNAYRELKGMLNDSVPLNFKRAVFVTENAYLDDTLKYTDFNQSISSLVETCNLIVSQSDLLYKESDKPIVAKYAAVFKLMTDSLRFYQDTSNYYTTIPYKYDFNDVFGERSWSNMFVIKLLATHTGNCHSLPYLYKILCEELGVKAYLAMAPNHAYIKLWCKKLGWYNTELTSGYFPIDAWIMASGYVHLDAIQNRVYMDTIDNKKAIAVCLADLAKGYEKKFKNKADLKFILKCCDLSIKYYPEYAFCLILKAETLKKKFENDMVLYHAKHPAEIFDKPQSKKLFDDMQNLYLHVHNLGYRKMPNDMYLSWLTDLERERAKYQNKEIQTLTR